MITFKQAKKAFPSACGYRARPGGPGRCYEGPLPGRTGSIFRELCPGCGYRHEGIEGIYTKRERVSA